MARFKFVVLIWGEEWNIFTSNSQHSSRQTGEGDAGFSWEVIDTQSQVQTDSGYKKLQPMLKYQVFIIQQKWDHDIIKTNEQKHF